jgi:hypothetical protein
LDQEDEHVNRIVVVAFWDAEASVWVATNDELHLATEAPTVEALVAKLPGMIQDLLEDVDADTEVPFEVIAHRQEAVRIRRVA